ncbi:MAG: hypothetical protein Roseis2KO_25570 [Roseivirga sp.]
MKNLSYLITSLLATLSFCACTDSPEQTTSASANYELSIVDSVQIDLLSSGLVIADVEDKTGNLLAIQSNPPVAYILSPNGEVLKKMDRLKDDPQAVGRILSGEFFEDGVALMGRMIVKTYDMDFNLRKSLRAHYNESGMIYMGLNHLHEFDTDQGNRLLSFFGPQTDEQAFFKGYYENYNLVDIINPSLVEKTNASNSGAGVDSVYQPLGGFSEDSRFLKGRAFYFLRPVFDVKNNQMIYAFEMDTTLFKMNLPNGDIEARYKIPFDDFILFDGYTMGMAGINEQNAPRDRSGRISHVYQIDDVEVIVYKSGMKLTDIEALDINATDFRQRLERIDYKKYLIVKNGKRLNSELRFPEKVSYLDLADKDGFIWGHQNVNILDEEPELITFYKLRVVASD